MNEANELDVLRSTWQQEETAIPLDLQKLVRRQGRWMRLHMAIEILIAIVFLAGSFVLALNQPGAEFVVLAIAVWIITLSAVIYSFTNRVGTWGPSTHDTQAFLRISVARCKAQLRSTRFGLYLLLAEVVGLASWHIWYWSGRTPVPGLRYWLAASLVPLICLAVLLVIRNRSRRQLARLLAIEHDLK